MLEILSESNAVSWRSIALSKCGRVFVSSGDYLLNGFGLHELKEDGSWLPVYYSPVDNEYQFHTHYLANIKELAFDKNDVLWAIQCFPEDRSKITLLAFDIDRNKCISYFTVTMHADIHVSKFRVWNGYAIISESKHQSLIFIRLADGKYRCMDVGFLIGKYIDITPGNGNSKDVVFSERQLIIEICDDKKSLIMIPSELGVMYHFKLNEITLLFTSDDLGFRTIDETIIPKIRINDICKDQDGQIFVADCTHKGISYLDKTGHLYPIVTADVISCINSITISNNHIFYMTTTQSHSAANKNNNETNLKASVVFNFHY
ncbi:hypothetical protein RZD54_003331 [Citrobacter freundii]|uniref:hypothetical protein n=1 Tax=Citrobacter freundii TaxID=546 RepID=UPI00103F5A19|nr:hypothetical protein [Citrobacter freundii]EKW7211318.1 hypothetical protein [Citrobacter freundii]ELO0987931.1 hypothetical protein [Citrobacter freundii]MDE8800897.1 hypothetical protein [Citrobacter freundii]MDE8806024.1 hypothetical protein [Citrobacter freundii]TCC22320.1 hypothetical protein EY921_03640 [Citrobacter freundii]